jgi:hypothetical protein
MKEFDDFHEEWWIAAAGDLLIWARLRVLPSGIAEILDNDGRTLPYDGEDSARAALMDADFRAFDGLDEDDAELLGFDLEEIEPPYGASDEELRPQMIRKIP